jgi:steroid 5-alpha reductase family enzyme
MNTPQEILQEAKVDRILQEAKAARTQAEEEKKKWAKLKGWAGAPRRFGILLFVYTLCTLFLFSRHPNDLKSWFLWPAFFLSNLSLILIGQQRRNKMLLEIIQKEAPELHQKLKDKRIAD